MEKHHHKHKEHHKEKQHHYGHKKHNHHPHDHMAAMPQFNEGHWEKDVNEVDSMDTRYASEMGAIGEYKKSVDGLVNYAKKHKAMH